jgi:hypothetical protein
MLGHLWFFRRIRSDHDEPATRGLENREDSLLRSMKEGHPAPLVVHDEDKGRAGLLSWGAMRRESRQRKEGMKTKNVSFALFPVGTEVQFHSTHVHAHASGIVIAYEVLRVLPYLGAVPRVRLRDGTECFATKPHDLRLARSG